MSYGLERQTKAYFDAVGAGEFSAFFFVKLKNLT